MDRLARIFGVHVEPRDDEEAAGQADPSPGDYDCPMPTAAEEEAMFQALEAERVRIEARGEELTRAYRGKEAMLRAALEGRLETRAEELPRGCYRREEHNQGPDVVSAFPGRMLGKPISDPMAFQKRAMFLVHYDARRRLPTADEQAADTH